MILIPNRDTYKIFDVVYALSQPNATKTYVHHLRFFTFIFMNEGAIIVLVTLPLCIRYRFRLHIPRRYTLIPSSFYGRLYFPSPMSVIGVWS